MHPLRGLPNEKSTRTILRCWLFLVVAALLSGGATLFAQVDQGTITGTITDPSGAVIPGVQVTVTQVATGFSLTGKTNSAGIYVFSPVKIGQYTVTATAPGFQTVTQTGLTVNVNGHAVADLHMQPGSVTQTVTVKSGAAQLLQREDASTGQVVSTRVINDTPLALRNYVFIAQLSAGVTESQGSRGEGKGDFDANGLRAEQNDFILDGVDNNSNQVDFLNGASFVVKPPPDALAEFKVQTGNFDAEFGHSAGAVINASIKSGTNHFNGDLWEYWRSNDLMARDYFNRKPTPQAAYHQNQFGGTIGGPIIKDKLFFFGDVEALRIISPTTSTYTVPTALMRQGNFSELLSTDPTQNSHVTNLFEPGSAGNAPMACNGQANVMCPNQIDTINQGILNMYPMPNAGVPGQTYNNYVFNRSTGDNTVSWDGRIDWNASQHDQAFFRMSYYNERGTYQPPFGTLLDGGGYGSDGEYVNMGENYALSETHEFSNSLVNEFRFGYNWGHPQWIPLSADINVPAELGLGGIPFNAGSGGLPNTSISGISSIGGPEFYPAIEYENVFQILDNVTKVMGKHTIKMGVDFQHVRVATTAPIEPDGAYSYNGFYTGSPGVSFTGSGVADYLADNDLPAGAPASWTAGSLNSAALSAYFNIDNIRWYKAAYVQDNWKITPTLTLNLGARYDYFQPVQERHDHQALWYPNTIAPGAGTSTFLLTNSQKNTYLAPGFLALLAKDNISLAYTSNRSLVKPQFSGISPRLGLAWSVSDRMVVRAGYGMFYGGLESIGGAPNMGYNYPFQYSVNFNAPGCYPSSSNCQILESVGNAYGINAANGFSTQPGWNNGLANDPNPSTPGLVGAQPQFKTPYTQQYNLSIQWALSPSMSWTLAYVGNNSRHIAGFMDQNAPDGLVGPKDNANHNRPFPDFGGSQYDVHEGVSEFNSLQTTLQKHYSNGLSFLTDYTWGHAMDDTQTPLNGGSNLYRMPLNLPMISEFATSDWDVRHRFVFSGQYNLPFGSGRKYLNRNGFLNELAGGWSTDLVFTAQTGDPFTVTPNNSGANGANARRAILTGAPFAPGGSPNATNPSISCASSTRNITHWYNPCAFSNPLPGSLITNTQTASNPAGNPLTNPADILPYVGPARNQIYGPGYERINGSLFKNFNTFEGEYLQFRADVFNLFNTPAFNNPGTSINSNGGQITGTRNLGQFTPNGRFLQLALKYYF